MAKVHACMASRCGDAALCYGMQLYDPSVGLEQADDDDENT
jgi:hypothetical protein